MYMILYLVEKTGKMKIVSSFSAIKGCFVITINVLNNKTIRAGNNGWSMDNVRPDWGFDRSNVGLASQVDRLHSIILK